MSLITRATDSFRHRQLHRRNEARAKRFLEDNPNLGDVIAGVREQQLTFLALAALAGLAEAMTDIERSGVSGAVVEAGTALGGSAIVLTAAKDPARRMAVYDTFGMIPPPSEKDGADVHERYEVIATGKSEGIGGQTYYGYREDLLSEIRSSFAEFGIPAEGNAVEFVQGVYQESMKIDFPVALAHIDCDWYESVMTCLDQIEPYLVRGGRLVIDDYDGWSGARTAVDEFFADREGYRFEHRARLHIVKE